MAINLYKDDDPNKKVGATGANSVGTSSVAPSSSPTPTAKPVPIAGETQNNEGVGTSVQKGPEASPSAKIETVDEKLAKIKTKIRNGEKLTPEEQKFYDGIASDYKVEKKNDESSKTKVSQLTPQQREKLKQYTALESEGGTEYEKTSRILDKYLSDNDESYQALKDKLANTKDKKVKASIENQLRAKRDKVIHDWQAIYNPGVENKNLTLKDRQRGIHQIGATFMYAGIYDIKGDEQLDQLKNSEIITDIKNNKFETLILSRQLKAITYRDEKGHIDADNVIRQFTELRLKHDAKYQSLTDENAKEEYRQNKIASTISDNLGYKITKEDLKNNKRVGFLKQIMAEMAAKAIEDGIDLNNLGPDEIKSLMHRKSKDIREQINRIQDEDTKKDAINFLTHLKVANELNKKDATEHHVYNALIAKMKDGTITPEEKDLLKKLDKIAKADISLLDEPINIKSAVSMSIILGEDIESIGNRGYQYIKDGKTREERENRLADFGEKIKNSTNGSKVLNKILLAYNKDYQNGDIKQLEHMMQKNERFANSVYENTIRTIVNANAKDPKSIEALGKAHLNMKWVKISEKHSKSLENAYAGMDMDTRKAANANTDFRTGAVGNKQLMQALTAGDRRSKTDKEIQELAYQCKGIGDYNFNAAYGEEIIKGAPPERQISLSKALLEVHDAGFTEGTAAAEQYVDASVRDEYSKNLTNEINEGVKKGYYTQEDAQNFQTARETGQTSYERTQASEGAKSNSSEHSVSNQQSNDAGSTQTVYSTGSKSSSINVSPQTQSIARETKTLIALNSQLNSENKKAEAMKKAADNIAKIQKDAIEREDSKAKQQEIKLQKQKLEEAKKENEKKSEEQLKAELSKVVDASIQEVQNELPQSAEGAVARQMLGDMYKNLKSYAQAGQLNQVYELLAKIPKAQELFIEKLATKHISVISHFIKTADKSVIRQLCELNPALISVLDKNTLLSIGIDKAKIIKYGDKDQIAGMLSDLQMASTKDTLNEFYEVMGIKNDEKDIEVASDALKKNDSTVDGGDDHMAKLLENMKRASSDIASSGVQGTVVPNWKEPGKKVPRELWG